jgi:hypothetical protein
MTKMDDSDDCRTAIVARCDLLLLAVHPRFYGRSVAIEDTGDLKARQAVAS